MTIMVIGGDHLGKIGGSLKEKGYTTIKHFTGRKQDAVAKRINENLDLILVLTDYVGTDLSRVVKSQAKKSGIKIAFARRSWSCISRELERVCKQPCAATCSDRPSRVAKASRRCGRVRCCEEE